MFIIRKILRETYFLVEFLTELLKEFVGECRYAVKRMRLWILIYQLRSIRLVNLQENVEVMSLVSHKDLLLYLCMIKSFFHFSGLNCATTVFDDGSLTLNDIIFLKKYIRGIRVVNKKEADKYITKRVARSKIKYSLKLRKECIYMRKKIDMPLFARRKKILILDSDLLFFRKPTEILNWVSERTVRKVIYMKDCYTSYIISNIEAEEIFKRKLIPYLNSGIVGFSLEYYDLDLVERFSKYLIKDTNIFYMRPPQVQAFFSLLFSKLNSEKRGYLSKKYLLSEDRFSIKNLVCRHYVRFVRGLFYEDGIKLLKEIKKFEQISLK